MEYLERQIERLKKRREDNPYLEVAQSQIRATSPEFENLKKQLETSLRRGDTSASAKLQATQELGEQYKGMAGDVYSQARAQNQVRLDEINRELDELEMRNDLADEEERKRKAKLKEQKDEMLMKVAGTVVGGGIGFVAGGGIPGAMAGAQIGGGLAGMGASTYGEFDANQMYEGLTDTISGFGSVATLKMENDLSKGWANFAEKTKGMSSDEIRNELTKMRFMSPRTLLEHLREFDNNTVQ